MLLVYFDLVYILIIRKSYRSVLIRTKKKSLLINLGFSILAYSNLRLYLAISLEKII